MDDTTTQLLTLLNVSALKRKRPITEPVDSPKLNKKKKTVLAFSSDPAPVVPPPLASLQNDAPTQDQDDEEGVHPEVNESDKDNECVFHCNKDPFSSSLRVSSCPHSL